MPVKLGTYFRNLKISCKICVRKVNLENDFQSHFSEFNTKIALVHVNPSPYENRKE